MGMYLGNDLITPVLFIEPKVQLNPPSLTKGIDVFTIRNPSDNGNYPKGYKVYIDGVIYKTVNKNFIASESVTISYVDDMSQFVGTHTLEVSLFGNDMLDSDKVSIEFTIYTISQTLTNMTSTNSNQYIYENNSYTNTLVPNESYYLPSNITLIMGGEDIKSTSYSDYTGTISIANVAGDISIIASGATENRLRTPWIILKDKELSIRTVQNATNYYLYMNGEQVWTQEVSLPIYTVEQVSDVNTEQFILNANDYYESQCKGLANSFSLCKIVFSGSGSCTLHCISDGESNFDYGIIGNINQTLSSSNVDDGDTGTTLVKKNFKGEPSTSVKDVVFDSINSGDFIMCKYIKDGHGDQGDDSLQFQVEVVG